MLKVKSDRNWFWRIVDFINPLRDPSLTVAAVLTFIEEIGQHDAWYWIVAILLVYWLAVRGVVWLVVNFTFAAVFISRRIWWGIKHPHLAWRIMDAIGHEEIVIGGIPALSDGMLLPDGSSMMMGANGFQVIGELPAGTEVPMLGMPGGQMTPDFATLHGNTGMLPNLFGGQQMNFPQNGNNGFVSQQSTDGFQQPFSQRSAEEQERLQQQISAYTRLLDDWIQFTEEKWRTVSDSQLGWKPLRGRWGNWDDIFQDAYAAKTSDPMARAAQLAGEATARRYDTSKEKGSAASAVACFMRDMMTLRQGFEMIQTPGDGLNETPNNQPAMQGSNSPFGNTGGAFGNPGRNNSGALNSGNLGNTSPRSSLIRRPAQIFVDADSNK